jgi:hypothetical protein
MINVTSSFLPYTKISISSIQTTCLPKSGIYFWWSNKAGMKRLDIPIEDPHVFYIEVDNIRYYLCYIGIGPVSKKSEATLPKRIKDNHLGTTIGSSTFRYSIASKWKLQFYKKDIKDKKEKFFIKDDGNTIKKFLEGNFILSIIADNQPWDKEKGYIQQYEPPLNCDHKNKNGWHFKSIRKARDEARRNSLQFDYTS